MSEKKTVGRNVAIILGIIVIILFAGLAGVVINYTSIINEKVNTIASLNSQIASLQETINMFNTSYTWLKQHSFTYYIVNDAINISNIGIFQESGFWNEWTINGTVTNISDKPIQTLYVYLILRNPDGTADFDPYEYERIDDLYIGETATFEFSIYDYDETQTVEILLVY